MSTPPRAVAAMSDDPDGDRRRLRGWRRRWTAVYTAAIVVVAGSIVFGALAGQHRHPGDHVSWTTVLVVTAVSLVVLAGVGVVAWRVQTRPGASRQLLAAGTWRTNRRAGIDLRKGRPIAPEDRRSAQALVDLYARRGWVVWFYVGLGVLWLALSFDSHGARLVLHLILGVFYLGFTPYWVASRRRTLRHGAEQGLHPRPLDRVVHSGS